MTVGDWALLAIFLGLLLTGVVLGASAWSRPSTHNPRALLDERLARGEIDLEEHAGRVRVLSGAGHASRRLGAVAAFVGVIGLFGAVVVAGTAAAAPGGSRGNAMMDRRDMPGTTDSRDMSNMMGSMMQAMMGAATSSTTCSTSASQPPTPPLVTIDSYQFCPNTLRVAAGTLVTWRNDDAVAHTVTSSSRGTFDSDTIRPGGSWTYRFRTSGAYGYFCEYHPWMRATVLITAPTT